MFLLSAFVVWLVMTAAETVHGILRTLLLAPRIGDFPAARSVFPSARYSSSPTCPSAGFEQERLLGYWPWVCSGSP